MPQHYDIMILSSYCASILYPLYGVSVFRPLGDASGRRGTSTLRGGRDKGVSTAAFFERWRSVHEGKATAMAIVLHKDNAVLKEDEDG